MKSGNKLPWLVAENSLEKTKWLEKSTIKKGEDQSSWMESDLMTEKKRSSRDYSAKTFGKRGNRPSGNKPEKRYGKTPVRSANHSTWEISAESLLVKASSLQIKEEKVGGQEWTMSRQRNDDIERGQSYEEVEDERPVWNNFLNV